MNTKETIGDAIESGLKTLDRLVPDTGARFRVEYGQLMEKHNIGYLNATRGTFVTGKFPELLGRIETTIAALP